LQDDDLESLPQVKPKSPRRVLAKNYAYLMALQAAYYLLPLITMPYLVRVLGTEKYGLLAFATALINFFIILTDFGFNLSATREISIHRDDAKAVGRIYSSVLAVKGALVLSSLVILALIVWAFPRFHEFWPIYFLTFGMVVGQALLPIWFFQGMEKMGFVTGLNLTAKIIFTLAVFIFVRKPEDIYWVPAVQSCGFIIAGLAGLWLAWSRFKVRFVHPAFADVKGAFRDSSMFFLSRVSVSIYTSSNAFFLGIFTTNEMVGFYSIAEKIYIALQGLFAPLSTALYPFMSRHKDMRAFKKIFKITVWANIAMCGIAFFIVPPVFHLFFGPGKELSIQAFRVFLLVTLVVGPSFLLGYPLLAAFGKTMEANKGIIYGSIFHLCGIALLMSMNRLSVVNVVVLVLLTETLVLATRLYWAGGIVGWKAKTP
jgi:polysaccharide transporter, PST family